MPRSTTFKDVRKAFIAFFHDPLREKIFSGRCTGSLTPSRSLCVPCSNGGRWIQRCLPPFSLLLSLLVLHVRYICLSYKFLIIYRPHNTRLFESPTNPSPSLSLSSFFSFFTPFSISLSPRHSVAALTQQKRWATTSALAPLVVEKEEKPLKKEADVGEGRGVITELGSIAWTGTYKTKKSRSKKKVIEVKEEKEEKKKGRVVKVKKCRLMKDAQGKEEDNPLEVKYAAESSDELLESAGMMSSLHLRRKLSQEKQQESDHRENSYRCGEEEDEDAFSVGEGVGEEVREEEGFTEFNPMEREDEVGSLVAEMNSAGMGRRKHFLLKRKRKKKKCRKRILRRKEEKIALLQMIESETMRADSTSAEGISHTEKEGGSSNVLDYESSNKKTQLQEEAKLEQRVKEGSKALIHHFPLIAAEYDVDANQQAGCVSTPSLDSLSIHSSSVVSWKCHKCHHCWKAAVFIRCILESGCPQCEAKAHPTVAMEKPEILSSWAREYNDPFLSLDSVTVDCSRSAHWRCPSCEHVYSARVKDQMHGQKVFCPSCGKTLFGKYPEKKRRKKRIPLPKIYFRQVFSESDPAAEARIVEAVKKAYALRKKLQEKCSSEANESTEGDCSRKRRSRKGEKKEKKRKKEHKSVEVEEVLEKSREKKSRTV